ncbi:MAG: hypothetical protein CNE95_05965 [Puniceicoccaceae bacterium MED-G30]|nr:MAG: hypothetical protein CNE95_05965 [Puniceicoccaceae bacterium MED-G30]
MESLRQNQTFGSQAFTLLELIGVLTIISILLAAAAPLTVDLIRTQQQAADDKYLPLIAAALKQGVLNEQLFPLDDNTFSNIQDAAPAGQADNRSWWQLAARYGAGSAREIRFPEGALFSASGRAIGRGGQDGIDINPRRLYLAAPNWSGQTFYETTGNGSNWLADENDPTELRMLLLSTTNPDLPLPADLSLTQFEAFWSNWSVGSDGNPGRQFSEYGLSEANWSGRAAELNLERIDLRGLLCRVVIENRRYIDPQFDASNELRTEFNVALGTYLADPLPALGSFNLNGAQASLKLGSVSTSNGQDLVDVVGLYLLQPGYPINEEEPAGFQVTGVQLSPSGDPVTTTPQKFDIYNESDADSSRAQIALINPLSNAVVQILDGWENTDDPIQDRFFLKTQELLLEEPWSGEEVGIFIINENYSTLRFDGLKWIY